uniref:Uncharacterized protein n=1 Tax=Aegilops tauschii subsp. strangulata TaxID=200361 RepID=A0A453DUF9_AEGTS
RTRRHGPRPALHKKEQKRGERVTLPKPTRVFYPFFVSNFVCLPKHDTWFSLRKKLLLSFYLCYLCSIRVSAHVSREVDVLSLSVQSPGALCSCL